MPGTALETNGENSHRKESHLSHWPPYTEKKQIIVLLLGIPTTQALCCVSAPDWLIWQSLSVSVSPWEKRKASEGVTLREPELWVALSPPWECLSVFVSTPPVFPPTTACLSYHLSSVAVPEIHPTGLVLCPGPLFSLTLSHSCVIFFFLARHTPHISQKSGVKIKWIESFLNEKKSILNDFMIFYRAR